MNIPLPAGYFTIDAEKRITSSTLYNTNRKNEPTGRVFIYTEAQVKEIIQKMGGKSCGY